VRPPGTGTLDLIADRETEKCAGYGCHERHASTSHVRLVRKHEAHLVLGGRGLVAVPDARVHGHQRRRNGIDIDDLRTHQLLLEAFGLGAAVPCDQLLVHTSAWL
jgi:hypothetical protein